MDTEGAAVKEMEAAAVAWVCQSCYRRPALDSNPFVCLARLLDVVALLPRLAQQLVPQAREDQDCLHDGAQVSNRIV